MVVRWGEGSRIARELRPGILKEFGLAPAVESHAEDFSARTGLKCELLCIDHDIDPDEETAIALFRVFQEALTNVMRHAQAQTVELTLSVEAHALCLSISDDGQGFIPATGRPTSFGLVGMRERVLMMGGTLSVHSVPGEGTTLSVRVPL